MTWLVLVASAALAGVAAAGILRPFGRSRQGTIEPLADPLQDERLSLLRALRDLDDERARGELTEQSYRILRSETEARAVAVLKALEARDGAGELATGISDLRSARARASRNGNRPVTTESGLTPRRRTLAAVVAAGVIVAVAVPLLAAAITNRAPGEPITGALPGQATESDLAFFQQRVAQHPNDVAARLDLAQRYLEGGDTRSAVEQYETALSLDPRNAEALATLGYVLFRSGEPDQGLSFVQQALRTDPSYPEALYFEGVILLDGLDRPGDAAAAFRAYLAAAPFGARRDEVQQLLDRAERGAG